MGKVCTRNRGRQRKRHEGERRGGEKGPGGHSEKGDAEDQVLSHGATGPARLEQQQAKNIGLQPLKGFQRLPEAIALPTTPQPPST